MHCYLDESRKDFHLQGGKWVLVKKHRNLPQSGEDGKITIPLAALSRQLRKGDDDAPNNEKPPLCYEEEDNHTCSYYYERGQKVI